MEIWMVVIITLAGVVLGAVVSAVWEWRSHIHLLRRLDDALRNKRHVCLNEQFLLTEALSRKIRAAKYKPDIIFAVSPGGAMVAEWLSRRFLGRIDKPIPLRIVWVDTERESQGLVVRTAQVKDRVKTVVGQLPQDSRVLLVTDICRGGATLNAAYDCLKEYFNKCDIATAALYWHVNSSVTPRFFASETDKDVRFDWKKPSIRA